MVQQLTKKQKQFIDGYVQGTYVTRTDSYLVAYRRKGGSRRTAMANASRVFNMPHVLAYYQHCQDRAAGFYF